MKSTLISFLLFFCLTSCFSQSRDSLLKAYNNQTIYRLGKKYLKGNEQFTFSQLQSEFNSNLAKGLYKSAKSNLIKAKIFNYTSLALIIFSTSLVAQNKKGAVELLIGTTALNLGNFYFRNQSAQFLDRAIWQRNKEVLFGLK